MISQPGITETLTAQLMAELALKNKLPTGALLRDVQAFNALYEEVAAARREPKGEVPLLQMRTARWYDVEEAARELQKFGLHTAVKSRDDIDTWLWQKSFFAKGYSELYGPRIHFLYYYFDGKTKSIQVSEKLYGLLDGAAYESIPDNFVPPMLAVEADRPDYGALLRQADDNLAVRLLAWMKEHGLLDDAAPVAAAPEADNDLGRLLPVLDEIYATLEPGGIMVLAEERTQIGNSFVGRSKAPRNDFEITRWSNRDKSIGPADFYVSLKIRVRKRTRTWIYRFLAGFTQNRLVSFESHDADLTRRYRHPDFANALLNLASAEPLAKRRYNDLFRPKRKAA